MKLETAPEPALRMKATLNPRGNLAKELEATAKNASWLSLLCGYWLAYHNDDAEAARRDPPTFKLPTKFPLADRYNKAYTNCGLWEPMAPTVKEGCRPAWGTRTEWGWIFDYWYSGGLDAGVEYLKRVLPEANVAAIEKELLK